MKIILCRLFLVLILLSTFPLSAAAGPPKTGDDLPKISLPSPADQKDKDYLGISGPDKFTVRQIQAPVILIQILSMYCPHCQKEAPNVNILFKMIEDNAELKDKIKIIGVGATNSAYETKLFRKKYKVPFPVLPDPDLLVYKQIGGEMGTPYFIGVSNDPDGQPKVIYSAAGSPGDMAEFLKTLRQFVKSR